MLWIKFVLRLWKDALMQQTTEITSSAVVKIMQN